jgi:cysteine desulfurase / selenocysteine lyase
MIDPPPLHADVPELLPKLGDRGLFPDLEPLVYCNHAGIAPPSLLVKKAVNTLLTDYTKWGAQAYPRWAAQRARLKKKLGALIGGDATDLALTQNTSRAVSDVALCFPWREGDEVIVFRGEFPANVTPWQRAAETFRLSIVMLDGDRFRTDAEEAMSQLRRALSSGRVKLCAISAVAFQTGYRQPLTEIARACHDHGARLFVDAVQACGMTPIDVRAQGIDYLASGAHKWLMGLEGAGFLYASPESASLLEPRVASWLSHENAIDFLFEGTGKLRHDKPLKRTIDFIEGANVSGTAFAALEASLDAILRIGVNAIFDHTNRFNDALEEKLVEDGFQSLRSREAAGRSGSLCCVVPDGIDVVALQRDLGRMGVATAIPDGRLRFSPHWPNALDEVDQIVLTLREALRIQRAL